MATRRARSRRGCRRRSGFRPGRAADALSPASAPATRPGLQAGRGCRAAWSTAAAAPAPRRRRSRRAAAGPGTRPAAPRDQRSSFVLRRDRVEEGAADAPTPSPRRTEIAPGGVGEVGEREVVTAFERAGVVELVSADDGPLWPQRPVHEEPCLPVAEVKAAPSEAGRMAEQAE